MSRLKLMLDSDPILHQKAKKVEIFDQSLVKLTEDMFETMIHEKGVGLAAPQINQSVRVFVVLKDKGYISFVNPEIYWKSAATNLGEEGCLSIPGCFGNVRRHNSIKLRYQDAYGNKFEAKFSGFIARVIQHENDHIDGILINEKFESDVVSKN